MAKMSQSDFQQHLKTSPLEHAFLTAWGTSRPAPEQQFKFHPTRLWRFDFAFPKYKIAVEINGGTFSHGRHTRGSSLHDEYDKLNAAVLLGWRVMLFDSQHLRDPLECAGRVGLLMSLVTDGVIGAKLPITLDCTKGK